MSSTFSQVLVSLALALSVTAVPVANGPGGSPTTPSCPATTVNANFEDVTGLPGPGLNPVPTPYNGLYYQSFDVPAVPAAGTLPALVPHSPPSAAVTSAMRQTTKGTPMLTVNYPNSRTKSFSLASFYFGCVTSLSNPAAALPSQCLVTVTGYRGDDNQVSAATQVCSQQFQYNPSTMTGAQQMAFSGTVEPCFQDIQFLIIQYSPPGGLSATSADMTLAFDNVAYSYKTC